MSAIARFLVEFDPTPLPMGGGAPAVPSLFAVAGDAFEATESLEEDLLGLAPEQGLDDTPLGDDDDVDVAVLETASDETGIASTEAVSAAIAAAEAGFAERPPLSRRSMRAPGSRTERAGSRNRPMCWPSASGGPAPTSRRASPKRWRTCSNLSCPTRARASRCASFARRSPA